MNRKIIAIFTLMMCCIAFSQNAEAQSPHDGMWHLKRAYDLFKSIPYKRRDPGLKDSVEVHFDKFHSTAKKYENDYGLGLFLASEFYKDISDINKEQEYLTEFLEIKKPEAYKIDLPIDHEPWNYYIKTVERLVDIKILEGDYYRAMKYAEEFKGYDLEAFMKRSSRSMEMKQAMLKSEIFAKQDRKDAAISVMLPHILILWDANSLDYSKKLLERLLVKYRIQKIRAEVEYGFRNMYQKDVELHEVDEDKPFYVTVFDLEIEVPKNSYMEHKNAFDNCMYTLWESDFYMVVNLKGE